MNYPNTYDTAIDTLRQNNIYPSRVMVGNDCIELEVYCMALLMDEEVDKIKEILGEGWKVDKLSNIEYITIKLKQ